MTTRSCILTRRSPQDLSFLRHTWENEAFMSDFLPLAPPLPASDTDLLLLLNYEYQTTLDKLPYLHWIIRSPDRTPWGLMSLCNISLTHKHAEIAMGVLPGKPYKLATAAMLTLFIFYFKSIKFHKLYSHIPTSNTHSAKSTAKLGFHQEAFLCQHFYNEKTDKFLDILQYAIFKENAFNIKNSRIINHLL